MENDRGKLKNLSMDELTQLIRKKKKQNSIELVARDTNVFPQSYAQSSQWFMQELATDCIYNVPQSYRIKGKVDIPRLARVLNRIVERHEIMRTVFAVVDGVLSQLIEPFTPFKLNVIDFSEYSREEQESRLKKENENLIRTPFDLSVGPLWKFILFKLSDDEVVLTYTLHHIISDGWSFGVIIKELIELYTRDAEGKEPMEPLPIQYVDYSEWQRKQMDSDKMKKQLEYWVKQLDGITDCINLPLDAPRFENQTYRGDNYYFTISKEDYEAVNNFCTKENITSYHLFMSVFFILLHRYSGDRDICIGTAMANRNRVELEKLIGLFINTVVIRANIEENQKITDFIQNVKQLSVEASENSEVPFEKVVEKMNISRQSSFSPAFQVLYVQMETTMLGGQTKYSGLEVSTIPISNGSSQFDLSLYVSIDDQKINFTLEYNTDLFSEKTAAQIAKDFQSLLHSILVKPGQEINYYLNRMEKRRCSLAVCSTFTSELLNESMSFWIKKLAIPCDIVFTPYSQVFQQLLLEDSIMRKNADGFNVIMLRLEDWVQGLETDSGEIKDSLVKNTEDFINAVNQAGIPDLSIYLCPRSKKIAENEDISSLISKLEQKIKKECPQVSVYAAAEAAEKYHLKDYLDEIGDKEWHVPYNREYFAVLGTRIVSDVFKKSIPDEKVI